PKTPADYATVKYDPNGHQLWAARYDGPTKGPDQAVALALDSSGNLLVAGSSQGYSYNFDYLTIKYAGDGTKLWEARYDGEGGDDDLAQALIVDSSGNVYVTGGSKSKRTGFDFARRIH